MKSNMMTIIKKELTRFFKDKRMVLSTIIMPGLMIYIIYSFMGQGIMQELMHDDAYAAAAYVQNLPQELAPALETLSAEWITVEDASAVENVKVQLAQKEADVLVVFPESFVEAVEAYDVSLGGAAPNVEIYYNSTKTESVHLRSQIIDILDSYESSLANKLDVNAGATVYDFASDRDMTAQIFSMMMPMLLMMFLYSGCMAVAPESIAGEKERGTIATLLITPMKRSSLALGKIIALSIIALLSGTSSFIGTFASLPNLMGGEELTGMDTAVYGVVDFLMLLGIVLSTVLIIVALISVISAFSKSVKEASTAVMPLMLLVMFMGMIPMFGGSGETALPLFLIPLYNSAQCIYGVFSFTYQPIQVIITMAVNVLASGVLTYVLTKLFNSEKVMFSS